MDENQHFSDYLLISLSPNLRAFTLRVEYNSKFIWFNKMLINSRVKNSN